jgi:hypothetical protein
MKYMKLCEDEKTKGERDIILPGIWGHRANLLETHFRIWVCLPVTSVGVLVFPAKIRTLLKFALFGMRQPYYER